MPLLFTYLEPCHYNFTHIQNMPLLTLWIHLHKKNWTKLPSFPFFLLHFFHFSFLLPSTTSKTNDSSVTMATRVTTAMDMATTNHCLLPLQHSFARDICVSLHLAPPSASSCAELHMNDDITVGPSVLAANNVFLQMPQHCGSSFP